MREIVNYSLIDARDLYEIKRYSDLVSRSLEVAKEGDFSIKTLKRVDNKEEDFLTREDSQRIWIFEKGSKEAPKKFLFKGGCHGPESASPKALYLLIKSFAQNKLALEDTFISIILADDPEGFDTETKMFVTRTGEEQHYPPQSKLEEWWEDVNGTWGKKSSPRIEALKNYIREVKPTYAVDFHETFHGIFPFLVFGNAGIMSIEEFHLEEEDLRRLLKCKIPRNPFWKILYSLYDFLPFRRKIQPQNYLKDNPYFQLGKKIMEHVKKKGFKIYPVKYPAILERNYYSQNFNFNPFWLNFFPWIGSLRDDNNPREIPIDYARFVEGFPLREADIKVCSRWMFEELGTYAFTTETFAHGNEDGGITERVGEDLAFAEGLIINTVE